MELRIKAPVVDTHIHIRGYDDIYETLEITNRIAKHCNLENSNVLALTAWDADSVAQNVLCLTCKVLWPRMYAYGGFDYFIDGIDTSKEGRLKQLKSLLDMGFDGVKLIETKPSSRKLIGKGLNNSAYRLCFEYMEKEQIPIIWHVADPEENWDKDLCEEYAKEHGWYYGDGTFLTKQEIYEEVFQVLDRHPKLNVTFAHMFFLSKDAGRAREILDAYPNVKFDLTPGREMYYNFNENYEEWRSFFFRYKDRLIFGTDNGWGDDLSPEEKIAAGCENLEMLKAYFSTENPLKLWNGSFVKGMKLSDEVLDAIFYYNFRRTCKTDNSKPVDLASVMEYAHMILERIQFRQDIQNKTKKQLIELIDILSSQGKENEQ